MMRYNLAFPSSASPQHCYTEAQCFSYRTTAEVKHHAMKTFVGVNLQIFPSTSTLDGGKFSAPRPNYFILEKEGAHDAHCVGVCVGPTAGLDGMEETKFLTLS
jgi:hypothetical protein